MLRAASYGPAYRERERERSKNKGEIEKKDKAMLNFEISL